MIYFIAFSVLSVLSAVEVFLRMQKKMVKQRKIIYLIAVCFLVLMAGLRKETGLDYSSYENFYDQFQNGEISVFNHVFEIGYSVANVIAPNFVILIFFMALSSICVKHRVFQELNIHCLLTIVLYYYASVFLFYDMGVMRQGLSIGIAWLSIPLALKKDKKFFIYILAAVIFHVSSAVFILVYFMGDKEYSRRFYYGIMCVCVAIYTLEANTSVMKQLISNIGFSFVKNKFEVYSAYGEVNLIWSILKRIFLMVLFVELFKKQSLAFGNYRIGNKEKTPFTWIYINALFLSTVLICLLPTVGLSYVAGRLTMCLYSVHIFLYEAVVSSSKSKLATVVWFTVFLILSYMSFSETLMGSAGNTYLPYESIFD